MTRDYIKTLAPHLKTTVMLFIISFAFGYLSLYFYPEYREILGGALQELQSVADFSQFSLFVFIFANNSIKILATVLLGVLLGVIPVFMVFLNGYFIGGVVYLGAATEGWGIILAGLLPHGIIEIPAFLISAAIGLMIGSHAAQKIFKKADYKIWNETKKGVRVFFVYLLPFIFIAALIEAYITPLFLDYFI